jgi:hypothetical protein
MESVFWFGFGILTGMAALPWLQRLADRARRTLAELELDDPWPRTRRPTTSGTGADEGLTAPSQGGAGLTSQDRRPGRPALRPGGTVDVLHGASVVALPAVGGPRRRAALASMPAAAALAAVQFTEANHG